MSFSFSQMSGSSGVTNITVSATSTTELVDLVESYTLANDNKEVGMALVQKAYAPLEKYIIFQPNSMSVESSGGTSSLNIQSNDSWEIISDDWIQLSRYETENRGGYNSLIGDGNTIVGLRFNENTGSSRNGGISGYCKSDSAISAATTVQQSGSYVKPYLALGQYQYNIESSGQSGCSLAVVSNLDWTVTTDARWITINTASGSSDGTISFNVQENSQNIGRRATITVTSTTESLFAECTVNQSASAVSVPYIIISPTDQTIPLSGGSFTISVSSNTDWDVAVIISEGGLSRPWISVDKFNGSGDDDVVVTVNAVGGSSEIESRSAYISFYNNKEGLKTECNITQEELVTLVDFVHMDGTLEYSDENCIDLGYVPTTATTATIRGRYNGDEGRYLLWADKTGDTNYYLYVNSWQSGYSYWRRAAFGLNSRNEVLEYSTTQSFSTAHTIGNFYLIGNRKYEGTTQSQINTTNTMKLNVTSWWFNSMELYEGETLIFNIHAAVKGNVVGVYDSVSQTFYTPTVPMVYEDGLL